MDRIYDLVSIYPSYCGDGHNAGRPATFIRFSGCNLPCSWCDSIHDRPLRRLTLKALVQEVMKNGREFVILTGGEPGLQVDRPLVDALRVAGHEVGIETNGTIDVSQLGLDWICVSPKGHTGGRMVMADWKQQTGDEIKVAFPDCMTMDILDQAEGFKHRFVSPIREGNLYRYNVDRCLDFLATNGDWRMTIDTTKILFFNGEGHE